MQANLDQILSLPENLELLARESRSLNVSPKRLLAEMGAISSPSAEEEASRSSEKSIRALLDEAIARLEIAKAGEGGPQNEEESAYDAAVRLGILGTIKDAPSTGKAIDIVP